MEGFRINPKTFLGLAMPCQYSLSESKYQACFGVIISGQYSRTFMIPICSTDNLYKLDMACRECFDICKVCMVFILVKYL